MIMAHNYMVDFLEWLIHQLPQDGSFSLELFFLSRLMCLLCIKSTQLSPVNIKITIKMDKKQVTLTHAHIRLWPFHPTASPKSGRKCLEPRSQ